MIIEVSNRRWCVEFMHDNPRDPLTGNLKDPPPLWNNKCTIYEVGPAPDNTPVNTLIYSGCAYCHPKDSFNKETGRMLSFKRSISNIVTEKKERREFWNALWKAMGKSSRVTA